MSGIPANIERDWAAVLRWMQVAFSWHRLFFFGFNGALTAANIITGPPWWGLWPLLISGLAFAIHYLFYKASVIDDAWVDERAADLYYKSYDQGHIDSISDRGELERVNDRLIEEGRQRSHDANRRARGPE